MTQEDEPGLLSCIVPEPVNTLDNKEELLLDLMMMAPDSTVKSGLAIKDEKVPNRRRKPENPIKQAPVAYIPAPVATVQGHHNTVQLDGPVEVPTIKA
jgi:hypothetical protein